MGLFLQPRSLHGAPSLTAELTTAIKCQTANDRTLTSSALYRSQTYGVHLFGTQNEIWLQYRSSKLSLNLSALIIPLISLTSSSVEIFFCNSQQNVPSGFRDSNILEYLLENRSFQYGNIQAANV